MLGSNGPTAVRVEAMETWRNGGVIGDQTAEDPRPEESRTSAMYSATFSKTSCRLRFICYYGSLPDEVGPGRWPQKKN